MAKPDLSQLKNVSEADRRQIEQAQEMLGPDPETMGFVKGLFWGTIREDLVFPYPNIVTPDETARCDQLLAELDDYLKNEHPHFEIDRDHLRPALDRFAQFFIAPAFHERYVDRERHAVHSEYQARLKHDSVRTWDAMKQVFNSEHPASRFTVGSLETLANDESGALRDALIAFWHRHYSADRMTLAVLGREPLAELERWTQTSLQTDVLPALHPDKAFTLLALPGEAT